MVKPLYPLSDISPEKRKKQKEAEKAKQEARKAYIVSLCKNPYIISFVAIILVLIVVVSIHSSRSSKVLDASAGPGGQKEGALSFLKSSKYFSSKTKDIGAAQKEQLKEMGIDDRVESMGMKVEAKDLREERKLLAMRKYEASRETAERRVKERQEKKEKLQSATALQLKEAVMAVEDSDSPLGIYRLETLLDEKLRQTGGDSQDADVLIFACDRLARAYQKRNMDAKAKEAYINAFKLMKSQAPESQGPDWDNAINTVEQIQARPSR